MLVPGLGLALRAYVWFGVPGEGGLETWDAIKVAAAQQQQQQYAAVAVVIMNAYWQMVIGLWSVGLTQRGICSD